MAKILYDLITSFEMGMNGGIEPLLLQKNQLARLENGTVRGAFISPRPKRKLHTINYGGDGALQAAVEQGWFQGSETYRRDTGEGEIIAQISGRLFRFIENGTAWACTEISIAGDWNNATSNQAWLWQAEKWMIISDGSGKYPIFYDGISCRRSTGPSVLLGTQTAVAPNPIKPPDIGETVSVPLTAPGFTGSCGQPVIFNGEYYEPIASVLANYTAILTPVSNATLGHVYPVGTDVVINSTFVGVLDSQVCPNFFNPLVNIGLLLPNPSVTVGSNLEIAGRIFIVAAIAIPSLVFTCTKGPGFISGCINAGTTVSFYPSGLPSSAGTILETSYTALGGGLPTDVVLSQTYSGADGVTVFINGEQFTISKYVPIPLGNPLILKNLSDGSGANYATGGTIVSVPELSASRIGCYGMGRIWISGLDGLSFLAGDIVGGASGTTAHNYRDAVLKTTENTFLESRGSFRLPGVGNYINSMTFLSVLDTAMGQGPLAIGTADNIFTCQVPLDRADWIALESPILTEALIGSGTTGQNSTQIVNSDLFFRSLDRLGTLKMARRSFADWGNTPISREIDNDLKNDDAALTECASSILFDNRRLLAINPTAGLRGIVFANVAAMNFDSVSTLGAKSNPCYDGIWKDWNILQMFDGLFGGYRRAFAFCAITDTIELYELLPTDTEDAAVDSTMIPTVMETPIVFGRDVKPLNQLVQLQDGEIYLKDIVGTATVTVQYRPDFYPCWTDWLTFSATADPASLPGYRTRLGLGEPSPDPCEPGNGMPLRNGHFFQVRITHTNCKFMGARFGATEVSASDFARPISGPLPVTQNLACPP